jgi:hypothetical protein
MYRSIVKNTITLIAETRNEIVAVKDVLKTVASGYEYNNRDAIGEWALQMAKCAS